MKPDRGDGSSKGPLDRFVKSGHNTRERGAASKGDSARTAEGSSFVACPACGTTGARRRCSSVVTRVVCGHSECFAHVPLLRPFRVFAPRGCAVALLLMDAHLDMCVSDPFAAPKRRKTGGSVKAEDSRLTAVRGEENAPALAAEAEQQLTRPQQPLELRWRNDVPAAGKPKFGQHTGRACAASAAVPLPANVLQTAALPGHVCVLDFLTEMEEEALLAAVDGPDSPPWHASTFNGRSHGKSWGVVMNLAERTVHEARVPFPEWMDKVVQRIRQAIPFLSNFSPNHVNAIWYDRTRGDYLRAHVDDRHLSGDIICNLSLAGACSMTYAPIKGGKAPVPASTTKVHLPRRCLQVQSGESRYNFTHAIALEDLEEPRRVSLTFRESPIRY